MIERSIQIYYRPRGGARVFACVCVCVCGGVCVCVGGGGGVKCLAEHCGDSDTFFFFPDRTILRQNYYHNGWGRGIMIITVRD